MLVYKTTTSANYTVIDLCLTDNTTVFVVEEKAEYQITLVLRYKGGYTSRSNVYTVRVEGLFYVSLCACMRINMLTWVFMFINYLTARFMRSCSPIYIYLYINIFLSRR